MDRIQALSNERQRLWAKAGHGALTFAEQNRIDVIGRELESLWDTYRRELAASSRNGRMHRRDQRDERVRDRAALPMKQAA